VLAEKIIEIVNKNKSFIYTEKMFTIHYCSEDREKIILIEIIR